jgi:hypothetical protein
MGNKRAKDLLAGKTRFFARIRRFQGAGFAAAAPFLRRTMPSSLAAKWLATKSVSRIIVAFICPKQNRERASLLGIAFVTQE